MIKDVVDKQFKVVKEYAGVKASVYYSIVSNAYIMEIESTSDTITEGFVHRCALDFNVNIIKWKVRFARNHSYLIEFLEG